MPDGPEGQALAAQARVSLRAAADRAYALGAPGQALAHLDELLELEPDEREAAALRERAGAIADDSGRHEAAIVHFRAAREAWEALGDRAAAAGAVAGLGRALVGTGRWDEAFELLAPAREAYGEVAATAGGVRLGAALAALYSKRNEDEAAIAEADGALVAAERLELVPVIVDLLVTKGTSMGTVARYHEAMALVEGAARLAERHGLVPQAVRAASMRSLITMDDDPRAAFDEGRPGPRDRAALRVPVLGRSTSSETRPSSASASANGPGRSPRSTSFSKRTSSRTTAWSRWPRG